MKNIIITNFCNQACSYCFAQNQMMNAKNLKEDMYIWQDNLQKIIQFYQKNNMKHITLAGWEPTLHPQFENVINTILQAGISITLFTNFNFNNQRLDFISKNSDKINFLANINHPSFYPSKTWEQINTNLSQLQSDKLKLSVNIYKKDFDFDYVFDLLQKYKIGREVRLGVMNPMIWQKQSFLSFSDIKTIWKEIVVFSQKLKKINCSASLDCGFNKCMFPKNLEKLNIRNLYFDCGSGAWDVGTDLSLWRCFALSIWDSKKTMQDFQDTFKLRSHWMIDVFPYQFGVLPIPECENCLDRQNLACQGPCLSHAIQHYQKTFSDLTKVDFDKLSPEWKIKYLWYAIAEKKDIQLDDFWDKIDDSVEKNLLQAFDQYHKWNHPKIQTFLELLQIEKLSPAQNKLYNMLDKFSQKNYKRLFVSQEQEERQQTESKYWELQTKFDELIKNNNWDKEKLKNEMLELLESKYLNDEEKGTLYINLWLIYAKLEDNPKAIEYTQKWVELKPDDTDAKEFLTILEKNK